MAVVTQAIQDQVSQLYIAYFGRAPEQDGFAFWANSLAQGMPVTTAALKMADSFEFKSAYNALTPDEQVTKLYQNVLDRAPDASGKAYWVNLLNTGTSIGAVAWGIVNSAFQQGTATDDGNLVLNKVKVAEYFAVTLGSNDKDIAKTAFDGVTEDPATVDAAEDRLYAEVNPTPTYTLTTSADNIVFTGEGSVEGIINFGGGTTATTASTMNSFDKITGSSAATDSLDVTLINASGGAIGGTAAVAQVNTYTPPAVTLNGKQSTQYLFSEVGGTADGAITFTYGGAAGSFVYDASVGDVTSANFAAAVNVVAGAEVAYVGAADTVSAAVAATSNSIKVDTASIPELVVGMSVSFSGSASGLYITAISAGTADTTITLNTAAGASLADNGAITFGGGADAVTVLAANAGTAGPSIAFTSTSGTAVVPTQTLIVANQSGNEGDTVSFTYDGVSGSYVIGADVAATATALAAAINAVTGGATGTATAAVASGGVTVTLTSNTAGIPLGTLSFSGSAGTNPTGTVTTANVTSSGAISFGTTTGVEILNLTNDSGSTATVSQNAIKSATQLWSDNSANAVIWTEVGKTTALGISGDGTAIAEGAVTGTYVAGTTAATLVVSNANAGAVVINGNADGLLVTQNVLSSGGAQATSGGTVNSLASLTLEESTTTLNVDAATSLTTGAITGAALKTISATGAATTVTLTELPATVTSIDGSGLTAGGITTTLNTAITSFTGGAGKDTVTTAATTASKAVIDGGAGTTDVLVLAAPNDVTTAAKGAQYVNFETLKSLQTSTYDSSLITGITSLDSGVGGAGFSKMTAALASNIKVSGDLSTTATTYSLASSTGSSDVLGLTFQSSTATTVLNGTGLAVSGFETVNLTASSGGKTIASKVAGTDYTSIAFGNATGVQTVTIGGAYAAKVDISSNATGVTSLNASGNTAVVDLKTGGQVGALVVTGSAGNDSFDLQALGTKGTLALDGGAGNDTISVATGALNNKFTIEGGEGNDTLTYTASNGQDIGILNLSSVNVLALTNGDNTSVTAADFRTVTGLDSIQLTATAARGFTLTRLNASTLIDIKTSTGVITTTLDTGSTQSVKVSAGSAGTYGIESLVVDAGTTVLTITTDNSVAAAAITADFDTVTGTNLETITVLGADATEFNSANVATTVTLIDASAATGKLTYTTGGTPRTTSTKISGSTTGDSILGGSGNDTITGGRGDDTLSGGHGTDTFIFASTGALNGLDTLTVTAGSGSDFDILNFGAFMPGGSVNQNGGTGSAIVAFTSANTADVNITNQIALYSDATSTNIDTTAKIAALIQGSGDAFSLTAGGKTILITGNAGSTSDAYNIWFINDALDGSSGTVTANDVVNVGTQAGIDLDTFLTTNFSFISA